MTGAFAASSVPFLDMAANQVELGAEPLTALKPVFADLGLALDSFVVENLSLPEESAEDAGQRIGMNMIGDMGRYTQFQVAKSMPIAAANEGGGAAGVGVGLGAGLTMAQQMMNAVKPVPTGPAGKRSAGSRCGDEVLHELRETHSEACQVLSGVRRSAAVGQTAGRSPSIDRFSGNLPGVPISTAPNRIPQPSR